MLNIVISRAYPVRGAYTPGPAAYLVIGTPSSEHTPLETGCDPQESLSGWADQIGQRVEAMLDRFGERLADRMVSVRDMDGGNAVTLIITTAEPELARRAAEYAIRTYEADLLASKDLPIDGLSLERELAELARFAEDYGVSPTGDAIAAVAEQRGIPVIRFDRWPLLSADGEVSGEAGRLLLQLGHGRNGRRITARGLIPGAVDALALVSDRQALTEQLRAAGLPTPERDPESHNVNRVQRALRAAEHVGYPVVLKPRFRASSGPAPRCIGTPTELSDVYAELAASHRQVIIEKYVDGQALRLLVIGESVAAAFRHPGPFGTEPCAGDRPGRELLELLHPAIREAAVEAARSLQLPVAAVDVVTRDMARPLCDTGGAIVDVDLVSDLLPYRRADERLPISVASRVVDQLFPDGATGTIPIVAVTGTNGKTTTCRIVARMIQEAGQTAGLACTDGVYVNQRLLHQGVMSGMKGAWLVLIQPEVDVAVLETSRGNLVTIGLAFQRSSVAACTNVASDHLGCEGIETLDQMAGLKRVVVETARDWVVLNAMDQRCREMSKHASARAICLVASASGVPAIAGHIDRGGCAVVVENEGSVPLIKVKRDGGESVLGDLREFPLTWKGLAEHNVENILHGVGLALGLGIPIDAIIRTLRTLRSSPEDTPSRLNVFDRLPFPVLLDFAHNGHGLTALTRFIRSWHASGRRVLVFPPRLRDREHDTRNNAMAIAGGYDEYILTDPPDEDEEIVEGQLPTVMGSALKDAGVPSDRICVIAEYREAIETALARCGPGDLLVLARQDNRLPCWQILEDYARARLAHADDMAGQAQ